MNKAMTPLLAIVAAALLAPAVPVQASLASAMAAEGVTPAPG